MTNGDRIRSMTDEEIAEVIWMICPTSGVNSKGCINVRCSQCWLEWLKQEVSDEQH